MFNSISESEWMELTTVITDCLPGSTSWIAECKFYPSKML